MVRVIGGREYEIPTESDGAIDVAQAREVIDVTPSEILIEQAPSGENFILPQGGHVQLHPNSQLITAPLIERGAVQ